MPPATDSLNPEDALCLRIGRVARAHVFLDNVLRNLHATLLSPTQGVYLTETVASTAKLAADCKTMVKHAPIRPDIVESGVAALDAAKLVNVERNRVVHDMWLRDPEDDDTDPVWQRARIDKRLTRSEPPKSQQFADLDQVRYDLESATIRVSALHKTLFFVLPTVARELPPTGVDFWVAISAGRFDRTDDGVFNVHGFGPLITDFARPS